MKELFVPFPIERKFSIKFLAVAQLVIFLALWNLVPGTGLPNLLDITAQWNVLALEHGLLLELWASIKTITVALLLSVFIAVILGALVTADIFKPVGSFVSAMRFLGFAGLTFLFTLWTADGYQFKLLLLTFGITVFMTTTIIAEVQAIPQSEIDYARTLKLSGWQITWEIFVRGRLHVILDLLRQNAAIGWTMLTMVEGLVRSEGGIGTLLITQNKFFVLSGVFAIQLTILAYGIIQDYLLRYLTTVACPHVVTTRSK
jgi:NitT/TauT family transport system permease protein